MRLPNEFSARCPRRYDHPLASEITLGFGGRARVFLEPRDTDELRDVVYGLRAIGTPYHLLGGGSNVLVPDQGAEIVVSTKRARTIVRDHTNPNQVVVDAGAALSSLVTRSRAWGLSGLECLAGIPGTVGAAVAINAGGKYGTIGPLVRRVQLLGSDGRAAERSVVTADFGYRSSRLAGSLILRVWLDLTPDRAQDIARRIHEVVTHKKQTQPLSERSAGCVFKNPKGDAAGRLIDRAGLKGRRVGRARISEVHANYFVNEGGASATEFLELMHIAQDEVASRFAIHLEPEVDVWA